MGFLGGLTITDFHYMTVIAKIIYNNDIIAVSIENNNDKIICYQPFFDKMYYTQSMNAGR